VSGFSVFFTAYCSPLTAHPLRAISEHKPQTAERFFARAFSKIVSD
jgi:hypothetical protein